MAETIHPFALRALGEGLAALAAKLTPEQAAQALIDAMKIPWMAGTPSEPLLAALQTRVGGEAELGFWETIAQIEQQFGDTIDLTSPPAGFQTSP